MDRLDESNRVMLGNMADWVSDAVDISDELDHQGARVLRLLQFLRDNRTVAYIRSTLCQFLDFEEASSAAEAEAYRLYEATGDERLRSTM